MKIIESNGKKTIKISKKEWEEIGKKNNWKIAQEGEPIRLTPNDTKIINVLRITKKEWENIGRKVFAWRPEDTKVPLSRMPEKYHNFEFDGITVSWIAQNGKHYEFSYDDLGKMAKEKMISPGGRVKKHLGFYDGKGTSEENFLYSLELFTSTKIKGEDPVEKTLLENSPIFGIIFDFRTSDKNLHRIKFSHVGEGTVVF